MTAQAGLRGLEAGGSLEVEGLEFAPRGRLKAEGFPDGSLRQWGVVLVAPPLMGPLLAVPVVVRSRDEIRAGPSCTCQ